ncbi:hypothetical protein JB92DRAFT_411077 [Gautieria morchelliformis]|nr:hypothetical protein JB92DRAFT_411077 [Gautieria morchelliformis]
MHPRPAGPAATSVRRSDGHLVTTVEGLSMLHTSHIGGSSYIDAAKIALLDSDLGVSAMDTILAKLSDNGHITPSKALKDPLLKLIVVPTALPAAKFHVGYGATHPESRMKVIFVHALCAAKCIILYSELCTAPQLLWSGIGMRVCLHCANSQRFTPSKPGPGPALLPGPGLEFDEPEPLQSPGF